MSAEWQQVLRSASCDDTHGVERSGAVSDEALLNAIAPLNAERTLGDGRYELLTPIGRGGMSVVWAARLAGSRGFSKMVAIKLMLPHLSSDPRFERMFLTEAQIASRIQHNNVCEVLDLGDQNGLLFLVMEWIDGEPLTAILAAEERMPFELVALVVADAGRGLHAAHELVSEDGERLGVVHRDVSPQNILVTPGGVVKIVDFGVAKAAASGDQTTQSGFIKGKVNYVAPEQVNGPDVDARTDVFALGVVLYELTTGAHPFRGATDLATLLAVASTDPAPAPSSLVADYPPALDAIVVKAVAKDPEDRYDTIDEMVADLDDFVESHGDVETIRDHMRDTLGVLLEPRRRERAQKLREAETSFEREKERRATRPSMAEAKPAAPSRSSRRTLALAIAGALTIGVGIGAAGRLGARTEAPRTSAAANAEPRVRPEPTAGRAEPAPPAPAQTSLSPAAVATSADVPSARPVAAIGQHRSASPTPAHPAHAASAPAPTLAASSGPRFRDPGF